MNEKYIPLFERFALRSGVELKNRIVMAPMTHFSSNQDGTVSDVELEYYQRRSNGVGLVITACTYATPSGKGFPGEFSAESDDMIPGLKRLASAIQSRGAKAVLQVFHGGSQCPPDCVPNGETVSASAVAPAAEGAPTPRPLTDAEILEIIRDFGEATRRAIEAGFDGVEIHGANGYLLQQCFSAHTNRREDRWGGSLSNRMAFPLAVVDEVQKVVAAHAKTPFVVGYRFSPEEPETQGITMEDTLVLVDALADKSLDYLHVSLMDFWSAPRRGVEEDSRTRLDWIQEKVGDRVPVMGVGSIQTADDALRAIQTGVPLIAIGRELIMEPDWVEKIVEGRESEIKTQLSKQEQERLVIPDLLWQAILNSPGWFKVAD
ncbi:NADH-dependent flavin oxidoreductase [Tumebacillus permanentifrigoris]|uniref:2,4-dienoyl-CoA reductase-like NADH-dependent reductase (Old Yellow Enzyme family) n=1 Tax=Tumebacillus permanentifrigoris TaxID=378543 RepID=A0A316DE59_9BACL|nr:NADH-dependent flavin oxidoreductase [Tumebacillus permanentifrigoris]PWK16491.1 2,4-dienoyl-CoA reductase-like NADH-dependent reductase (Old Yellow Enzyme family) [Tumebacillus permanentifrigoris]